MDHSYGFEQHVAQQNRRDKLRVSPGNNFDHSCLNPDLVRIRSVKNAVSPSDPSLLPSEMIDFSVDSNVLSDQRDNNIMFRQELGPAPCGRQFVTTVEDASFSNSLLRASGDVVNGGYWKSSQQNCDWVVNCANNSLGDDITSSSMLNDSTYIGFQSSSSFINPSGESFNHDSRKRLGESHFPSPLYQNTLHDVVTSASIVQHNFREINRAGCEGSGNELALLPAFRDQSNGFPFDNNGSWTDRTYDNFRSWVGDLGSIARKNDEEMSTFMNDSSNPQGLSLSLSSNPPTKLHTTNFEESEDLRETNNNMLKNLQDSRTVKTEDLCRLPKPFIADKYCGKSLQDMLGVPVNTYRNTGPLGPFTGYATILKSSKFLKPAQLLLDEFCGSDCPKFNKSCEVFEKTYVEVISSASSDAAARNAFRNEVGVQGNNSRAKASTFYASNETSVSGVGSISPESHQPEYQQKKAKLLYMLEEICRRYKQYHQQMQMVVSSFESVAGLGSATPYISLALKIVSRHFRCLKNAITEQLKYLKKVLGEDLSSPTTAGTSSSSKGDIDSAKLKYMEQSLQKQKPGIVNVAGFLESQHVWRPQRGLPERAVAILRAWLFEHFLHPYPTDTDKHMLATQTGLSRNQVSNWFINARVRVWKPMVEEIHMLETKAGLTEMNKSHGTNDGISSSMENTDWTRSDHRLKNHGVNDQQWNHEKQSKLDGGVQSNMEGEFIGFMPYQSQPQPSTVEVGAGLGAVSLTLGLRHRVESAHHQQHLQQQNDQLMRQYGSEMIHEFVG